MNNALATIQPNEWDTMLSMARVLVQSKFLPNAIQTPEQAVTIMLAGRAIGVDAWTALQNINVIQGKPTVNPQLMLALIRNSGQLTDIEIVGDAQQCSVTMQRRGEIPHTELFTMQDAGKMGLSGKDNWKKQPAVMLKWRAVSACARVVFPDVILGLYMPEEMGATIDPETGEVLQQPNEPIPVLQAPQGAPQTPQGAPKPPAPVVVANPMAEAFTELEKEYSNPTTEARKAAFKAQVARLQDEGKLTAKSGAQDIIAAVKLDLMPRMAEVAR